MALLHPAFLALFLSTLSLRRATRTVNLYNNSRTNFYPRSPCGERHTKIVAVKFQCYISIHALLAESDHGAYAPAPPGEKFLSTLSLRRATKFCNVLHGCVTIFLSTLSLRRATLHASMYNIDIKNFYPRSPCGERLKAL